MTQVAAKYSHVYEGHFLGREHERGASSKPPQILILLLAEVIPDGDEHDQRPDDHIHIVANIARVVSNERRNQEDKAGEQCSYTAEPTAQQIRQNHQDDAKDGYRNTCCKITVSKQPV